MTKKLALISRLTENLFNEKMSKYGAKEKSIEIAKEMLKKELPINMICEITHLTKEEIEKINKEKSY